MNLRTILSLSLLTLTTTSGTGCVTKVMWEGYTGSTGSSHKRVERDEPEQLTRAARSSQGQYRLEVRHASGQRRVLSFWPQDLAEAAAPHQDPLPTLPVAEVVVPQGEPGWTEVGVADGEPSARPDLELWQRALQGGEPPRVVFRQRGRVLEWREGHDAFRPVALLPAPEVDRWVCDEALTPGDALLGAAVILATPATVALDVGLGWLLLVDAIL